ncbi:MAG: hypothetical protein QNJ81_01200 [Acidimicrobiia bacterium]|nr:hypothetical protein [Acidimicrobiia bacterium]
MTLVRCGVGSLPHIDPEIAADFVLATCDVPYLPQLPNRHPQESMLVQWGDGIGGAGVDGNTLAVGGHPGISEEAFRGAAATLARVNGGQVKTQATGPVTLAAALRAGGVDAPGLVQQVTKELLARIELHLDWVGGHADDVVLVLDEPALAALGEHDTIPDAARSALESIVASLGVSVGLHCCGDTDWGGVADIGFDWLSWDVSTFGSGFHNGVDRIARALGKGTRIMWGIVPTTPGPLPETHVLVGRYGTAVANLVVAGAPFAALRADAWFTPACGLAGVSVAEAEKVADKLAEVVGEVESGW